MPTYIYRCQTCEKEFEIVQSFKDDPLEECPSECVGTVKKVFSGVGISSVSYTHLTLPTIYSV